MKTQKFSTVENARKCANMRFFMQFSTVSTKFPQAECRKCTFLSADAFLSIPCRNFFRHDNHVPPPFRAESDRKFSFFVRFLLTDCSYYNTDLRRYSNTKSVIFSFDFRVKSTLHAFGRFFSPVEDGSPLPPFSHPKSKKQNTLADILLFVYHYLHSMRFQTLAKQAYHAPISPRFSLRGG